MIGQVKSYAMESTRRMGSSNTIDNTNLADATGNAVDKTDDKGERSGDCIHQSESFHTDELYR